MPDLKVPDNPILVLFGARENPFDFWTMSKNWKAAVVSQ